MSKGDIPVVSAQRSDRPRSRQAGLTHRFLSAGTRRGSRRSCPSRQEERGDGQSCESRVPGHLMALGRSGGQIR